MNHIDISNLVQDFHHHVALNRNVILSGAFGSGKSYMLDEFKRAYCDEFNTITIYPINYAVSGNADIMEYIKHDIIFQLVQEGYITEQTDFSKAASAVFTPENIGKMATRLLANIPGGNLIAGAIEAGIEAKKTYDEEKKTVSKFMEGFQKAGSIYERDVYTEMIRLGLDEGRRRDRKKWILFIEDLDRIDPKNIFRLLNVFGAHLDCRYVSGEEAETNKFGFDKIVFVLDYWQTAAIYNQYFGIDTENSWEGYISKFLSSQPFYFKSVAAMARKEVLEFIARECRLDDNVIETIFAGNYSVRSLSKVSSDNFGSFLRTRRIDLPDGKSLATDCQLTRLLFYLQQLNGNMNRIRDISERHPIEYVSILAPVILYHHQSSTLCVDYILPDREREYDLDVMDDESDTDLHNFFIATVTSNGNVEVKSASSVCNAVEISSGSRFFELMSGAINRFCEEFTRYRVLSE